MRLTLTVAAFILSAALQANAAPIHIPTPAKAQMRVGQQPIAVAPKWAFDEYLELHRQSGYAWYAAPFEATDVPMTRTSCLRPRAANIH
jgi:hypothetical protein